MEQRDNIDFFVGPPQGALEPTWKTAVENGSATRYGLPSTPLGQAWGNWSVRRVARTLGAQTKAANCYRISAQQTDVVLYRFAGSTFGGLFTAVRVPKGTIRYGRVSGMGSFILQRDAFIDLDTVKPAQLFATMVRNSILPTNFLADRMTGVVHDIAREQRHRFYDHRLNLVRGRLYWDSLEGAAQLVGSDNIVIERERWPYYDYLRYSYMCRGRLQADGAKYDIAIEMWIEPILSDGRLEFRERLWRVHVSRHIWHNRIEKEMVEAIKPAFAAVGQEMTKGLRDSLQSLFGAETSDEILTGNRQLIFAHPCIFDVQRVGSPDHTFSSEQISNVCGWTTPTYALAPALRLLK